MILFFEVLVLFIMFKVWLNLCFAGMLIRADTPDRDVVIYMAKFWGFIVAMIYMVYRIIVSIIGFF